MIYTNANKDEGYAVRTIKSTIAIPRGQYIFRHFFQTPILKKHLKSTKIAQTTPKFDVHLPLIIAFRPVQSEMQYDFFLKE